MSIRLQHAVWVSSLLILAAAVCSYSVMAGNHFVDSPHNGFFLKNAIDLLEGHVMFRDSLNSYGFLSTLIHAAGMTIWGWRITSLLNVTLVFVVALGLGVYYLWCKVMPPWAAFLAASLYFVYNYRIHLPWPNYYATFFILCAGGLLMKWLRSPHKRHWLVAAGVMAGLVFLARQTLSPPLIVLAGFFIIFASASAGPTNRRLAGLLIFLVSFVVAVLPLFVYLYFQAALYDWWIQSVRLIPLWYKPFAQTGDTFLSQFAYFMKLLFGELPFLTLVAVATSFAFCLLLVLKRFSSDEKGPSLLGVISLAMLSQVYPDEGLWRHTLGLSLGYGWPIYLPYLLFASQRFGRLRRHPFLVRMSFVPMYVLPVFLALALPKIASVYEEVRAAFNLEEHKETYFQYVTKPEVFKGMWLPTEQALYYSAIYDEIETFRNQHPDTPVITTNGDVLPLTFIRNNEGFNPMFTIYPSIAWANIARHPLAKENSNQVESMLALHRKNRDFEWDTANVLAYPDYWSKYAAFVSSRKPLIISSGEPVEHYFQVKMVFDGYIQMRSVVFHGSPEVIDSQYYFWWSQFADKPRSVIWKPRP